jgi:RNA polymerase primary sigma factor
MVSRIARQVNGLRQELEREPTQQEIAAGMDVSEADIVSSLAISRGHLSLDAPIGDGQDAKLLDYLSDESSAAPDVDVVDRALTDTVQEALGGLRDREATVLRMYFGFDGADALTLEEIGKQMGITRERVRQIKEKALKRIRRSQQARALAAFCEH